MTHLQKTHWLQWLIHEWPIDLNDPIHLNDSIHSNDPFTWMTHSLESVFQ